jgi:hypothetical protein
MLGSYLVLVTLHHSTKVVLSKTFSVGDTNIIFSVLSNLISLLVSFVSIFMITLYD